MFLLTVTAFPDVGDPENKASLDDKKIDAALKGLAQGDMQKLDEVYNLTKSGIYAFILSILGRPEEAEDVLQDTYVKVALNASRYRSGGKPLAWIVTIARNLALMRIRSSAHTVMLSDEEWNTVAGNSSGEFGTEDRMVLKKAFEILGDDEREIVLLHAVNGLKHREIADIYGMPLATVLSKYNRAIRKLSKALKS